MAGTTGCSILWMSSVDPCRVFFFYFFLFISGGGHTSTSESGYLTKILSQRQMQNHFRKCILISSENPFIIVVAAGVVVGIWDSGTFGLHDLQPRECEIGDAKKILLQRVFLA